MSLFLGLHVNEYGLERFRERFANFFGVPVPPLRGSELAVPVANSLLLRAFLARASPTIHHETYYTGVRIGRRARRVLTVYDMIHELFPRQFLGDRVALHKRAAVSRADAIIAISHSTKRDLMEKLRVSEDRIEVVHLATSMKEAPAPNRRARPYFLFVGARGGYKNFHLAVDALQASSRLVGDFDLVAFGGARPSEAERADLRKRAPDTGVCFEAGNDQQLATLYANAAALLYPSAYEGFGLPILEAMHYGCPVICSPVSSIPEVAGSAASFFEVGQVDALSHQMERVALDEGHRRELIRLGLLREQQFSWERCADETLAVYRRLT